MRIPALASPGTAFGVASAALFGASMLLAKLMLGQVDARMLAGLLYLGSRIGLSAVHFWAPLLRHRAA